MNSSQPTHSAFQASTLVSPSSSSSSSATLRPQHACHRRRPAATSISMTATVPSKPSTSAPPSRSLHQRTAPPPAPARVHEQDELLIYQSFLQSCSPADRKALTRAPVFKAPNGTLVCQWHPALSHAYNSANDYEAFLASPQAAGVDPTAHVFLAPGGGLVCQYPRQTHPQPR